MEGPRSPRPEEVVKVLDFLNQSLRKDSGWPIHAEYPNTLTLANRHNMRIITDQEKIVSHAVVKPLVVKTPEFVFRVGLIGSVVTDERFRNRGFSRNIIESCLDTCAEQDCDIAVLWSDLHDFYRKMGFEPAGSELAFTVDKEIAPLLEGAKYLNSTKVDPGALLRLYSQHSVAGARSAEDIRKFLDIPNTKLYTSWDPNGQLLAFAIEGKGEDLKGYIHEWGGGVSKLLSLLTFIYLQKKTPFTFITPSHALNLIRSLSGLECHKGYLGLIKLVRPERLLKKLQAYSVSVGIPQFMCRCEGDKYTVGIGVDTAECCDEKEVVKLLFGPNIEDSDVFFRFQNQTKDKLKKLLPLKFWIWGWDSI